TRGSPGYVLLVAKDGPKLKETTGDEEAPIRVREGNRFVIRGRSSVKTLAEFLSKRVLPIGGPASSNLVLDKTGLTGTYDYVLKVKLIDRATGQVHPSDAEFNAPIREALETQLGLRLESLQVPVEVIVVEDAERPSDN